MRRILLLPSGSQEFDTLRGSLFVRDSDLIQPPGIL